MGLGQLLEQTVVLPEQVEVLLPGLILSGLPAEAFLRCFALLPKWSHNAIACCFFRQISLGNNVLEYVILCAFDRKMQEVLSLS